MPKEAIARIRGAYQRRREVQPQPAVGGNGERARVGGEQAEVQREEAHRHGVADHGHVARLSPTQPAYGTCQSATTDKLRRARWEKL